MALRGRNELPLIKKIEHIKVDIDKLYECIKDSIPGFDSISDACGSNLLSPGYLQLTLTTSSEYKDHNGFEDERTYGELLPEYKGTYLEEVISMFKSRVTRVRLLIKPQGEYMLPHIDYDTTYSMRYWLPIKTNPWAMIGLQKRGSSEVEVYHLPADGSIWFVNPGQTHSGWNFGKDHDIRIIFSVDGQEDFE